MTLEEILASIPEDLGTLDDAALEQLRYDVRAAAREARDGDNFTPEVGALIRCAADSHKAVTAERDMRVAAAAQVLAETEAALLEFGDDDDLNAPTPDGLVSPGDEGPATLAASAGVRRAVRVPARHQPRVNNRGGAMTMRASTHDGNGQTYADDTALTEAIATTFQTMRRLGQQGERHVAHIEWRDAYPDDARISDGANANDNGERIATVVHRFIESRRAARALIASGGIPGPGEPRYIIPTFGSVARPLRDALPQLLAPRGEILYNGAPTIEDVLVDTSAGAIGTVTSAQDAAGATKNVQEIATPTPKTAIVEAETMRLQHGMFTDRFLPEYTAAWMSNVQVRFARHNEARRFNDIATASTHMTDTPAKFGAWRDLKRCILGVAEELEDRLRDPNLPITILMPEYVPAMCAADLVAQAPGDSAWTVTEDQVRAQLQMLDPNIDFAFVWDGNQTGQRLLTTPTNPGGGASSRTPGFDSDVDFIAFPTGTFAFMDSGELDLGVLHDSVLSATNKFQTFYECFEGVTQLAPFSYHVTISLCADGNSQAPQNVGICSPQGS